MFTDKNYLNKAQDTDLNSQSQNASKNLRSVKTTQRKSKLKEN